MNETHGVFGGNGDVMLLNVKECVEDGYCVCVCVEMI